MNSEQLIKLFRAFVGKDDESFHALALEIIESEERKNHQLLAEKLKDILNNKSNGSERSIGFQNNIPPIPRDNEKGFKLLEVNEYYLSWNDVVLKDEAVKSLKDVVEEIENEELLATYGLKPKLKLLFYGPPGTGKTLSAKVLSSVLRYPLVFIKFESVISSYLGQTASNLRKIFDYLEHGRWVVLFDEFDIIGKKRDDPSEHGEIKRVVNNFMLLLEHYQGDSVVVASTNHPQLLDSGIWRRFDEIILFDLPSASDRVKIFKKYLSNLKKSRHYDYNELAKQSERLSGADIERATKDAIKSALIMGLDYVTYEKILESINKQKKRKEALEQVLIT